MGWCCQWSTFWERWAYHFKCIFCLNLFVFLTSRDVLPRNNIYHFSFYCIQDLIKAWICLTWKSAEAAIRNWKKKIESMFAKWRCEGGKMPFLSRCLKISLTDILRTFFACSCFRLRILRISSKYPNASKISCSSIFSPSLFFICCSFEADLIYALHIYAFCLEYAIHQQVSGYQKRTENGKKSFSFRGAKLWSSLSANCKQAASLSIFKQYIQ